MSHCRPLTEKELEERRELVRLRHLEKTAAQRQPPENEGNSGSDLAKKQEESDQG